MIASVERSQVSGVVSVPPSKSYTHRAITISALGPGGMVMRPLLSADTRATINASEAFGAQIEGGEPELLLIGVAILVVIALFDIMVGVSNDAVNFLTPSIGSRVAPWTVIMVVASLGIMARGISRGSTCAMR